MKQEITYDTLLEKIPNKYILTIAAGKRVREIVNGSPVLVKTSKKDTLVRKVFKEIVEGKLTYSMEETPVSK
ncbi:MAG: DNA-directed RNA polymerase subunit omega [Fusobacterium sp.]|jgi:DNA-directed RNA polymerase subunit omega|uniref:DNA-directed RNA polymerase subunit omega n=1 Tax=Fusobacterium sp. SB021 TaxID=2744227 RepID=UPI001D43D9BD|nr:DNA-directed RNA polymerase subunit omega [Fusobacterium sp.]